MTCVVILFTIYLYQQKQLEMNTRTFKTLTELIPTTELDLDWDYDCGIYEQENELIEFNLSPTEYCTIDIKLYAQSEGWTRPGSYEFPPEFVETNRTVSIEINHVWIEDEDVSEEMSDEQWIELEKTIKNSINF